MMPSSASTRIDFRNPHFVVFEKCRCCERVADVLYEVSIPHDTSSMDLVLPTEIDVICLSAGRQNRGLKDLLDL